MIDSVTRIADRYRIDARLGGGGMADVFDAHDEVLDRPVAVKLLRGIDDAGAARRFADEIRLTARVNHPNIVSLFDAGEHDGSPYLVLERVTGGTLAQEMAAGPMDPRRVAEMGEQLASALSHSHAAGIVHRDVKPSNILLTSEGSVRLADFGIAVTATATRLTVTGTIAGSAGYVSPEQVLGSGAGAPSDIYALGLVLLECLTGAPPWSGTTVEVALARITADPPIPGDLPDEWRTLLRSMTARDPDDRPPIDAVGFALSRLAVDESFDQRLFALPAPPSDRRVPAVAGMTLVVLLTSAFVTLSSQAPTNLAVAAGAPPVNVPIANSILAPAVLPSSSPALADRNLGAEESQEETARRTSRRKPAASTPKGQAPQRANAGAGTTVADQDGGGSGDTGDDLLSTIDLPRAPRTTTNVDAPAVDDAVDTVTDTVDKGTDAVGDGTDPIETTTKKGKAAVKRPAHAPTDPSDNNGTQDRRTQRTIDRVIQSLGKTEK